LVKCPGCGKEVYYANDDCPDCKTPLKDDNILIPAEDKKPDRPTEKEKSNPFASPIPGLAPCPVCKKEISPKALFCVGCGHPMRTSFGELIYKRLGQSSYTQKIYALLKWITIISVALGLILGVWHGYQWNEIRKKQEEVEFYRKYGKEIEKVRKEYGLK